MPGRQASDTLVRIADVAGGGGGRLAAVELGYSDGFHTIVARGIDEGDVILVRSSEAERG